MNEDRFDEQFTALSQALCRDDPAFSERLRRLRHGDARNACAVFALLALGAVLLTAGFATLSLTTWAIGVGALVTACVVDQRHRRSLGRIPRSRGPHRLTGRS